VRYEAYAKIATDRVFTYRESLAACCAGVSPDLNLPAPLATMPQR
jgi:hypothetical protein